MDVTVTVRQGDTLTAGQIYATCPETPAIEHRCMVPPNLSGRVSAVMTNGQYTVNDCVVKLVDKDGVSMSSPCARSGRSGWSAQSSSGCPLSVL